MTRTVEINPTVHPKGCPSRPNIYRLRRSLAFEGLALWALGGAWTLRKLKNSESGLLGGSWDVVSTVISTLIGVISNHKYSYLIYSNSGYVP